MPKDGEFGVFSQDEKGSIWRGSFSDLESAKAIARTLALKEGLEFFVRSLGDVSEIVARFFPKPKPGIPEPLKVPTA